MVSLSYSEDKKAISALTFHQADMALTDYLNFFVTMGSDPIVNFFRSFTLNIRK